MPQLGENEKINVYQFSWSVNYSNPSNVPNNRTGSYCWQKNYSKIIKEIERKIQEAKWSFQVGVQISTYVY